LIEDKEKNETVINSVLDLIKEKSGKEIYKIISFFKKEADRYVRFADETQSIPEKKCYQCEKYISSHLLNGNEIIYLCEECYRAINTEYGQIK